MFDRCVAVLLAMFAWFSSGLTVYGARQRLWERQREMLSVAALLGKESHLCGVRVYSKAHQH